MIEQLVYYLSFFRLSWAVVLLVGACPEERDCEPYGIQIDVIVGVSTTESSHQVTDVEVKEEEKYRYAIGAVTYQLMAE